MNWQHKEGNGMPHSLVYPNVATGTIQLVLCRQVVQRRRGLTADTRV